jgi:hypothetical protein
VCVRARARACVSSLNVSMEFWLFFLMGLHVFFWKALVHYNQDGLVIID